MTFYVGQKVVCVTTTDEAIPPILAGSWNGDEPTIGAVYTIAKILTCPLSGIEMVHLVELRRAKSAEKYWGYPVGYGAFRFRPVTDISDLQAIVAEQLAGKPRKIKDDQFDKQRVTR